MRRAVLFDLDDTLFDHQHSRRTALGALRERYPAAAAYEFFALERLQEKHLQATHALLLSGKLTVPEARRERMRLLFRDLGVDPAADELDRADAAFRAAYQAARRPVPGAIELLRALRGRCRTCVVTNGLAATQMEKIRHCGLESLLDDIVISEEVGATKPHRAIFDIALRRAKCSPPETVMAGDSWRFDVMGARNAGIAAVWLNRYGESNPEPGVVKELTALEPVESVLAILEV